MTYKELWERGKTILEEAGVPEAGLDARLLLQYAFELSYSDYLLRQEQEAGTERAGRYESCICDRSRRIPLQHIIGTAEFMGLTFRVNGSVLIPRQDTEALTEELLAFTKGRDVLDLCTGSGCIAVSLSRMGHCRSVTASDVSEEALAVARDNARLNQADITWIQSDLFQKIEGNFDLIVSNPPYIPTKVIEKLEPEVREYDPRLALDGKEDGLYFYRRICREAPGHLRDGGLLAVEIGSDQGASVKDLFREAGLREIRVGKDLAGLDRYVMGWMKQ